MPVTAADVARWADLELSEDDETVMTAVITAVTSAVAHSFDVPETEPADVTQAITMQSARLYKRRGTPNGLEGVTGEFVARVSRFDPDVASLLAPFERWSMA